MVEKNRSLPKGAFVANAVLCGGVLFFSFALLYALFLSNLDELRWKLTHSVVFISGLAFYGISLFWPSERKTNLALITISLFLSVYASEIIVAAFFQDIDRTNHYAERLRAAQKAGLSYDSREKLEVLSDLRARGIDAWPGSGPTIIMEAGGLFAGGEKIFPLSTVSNITVVDCIESGMWSVFRTDEHGFRNPRGVHQKAGADLLLLGDSFAWGSCLLEGRDLASQLRSAGLQAVTLGIPGNGPLCELATLTEYAAPLQPKVVLWLYFEGNDPEDLFMEQRVPTLMRYLQEDGFSQSLRSKQQVIDESLKAYITAREEAKIRAREQGVLARIRVAHVARLWHLRRHVFQPLFPVKFPHNAALIGEVLSRAHERVHGWGGRLYFVYLPSSARYIPGVAHHDHIAHRALVLPKVKGLGIPVIDFTDVLDEHQDPLSLYPLRVSGHYTAEGYRLLAETMLARLTRDGIEPPASRDMATAKPRKGT